MRKILFLLPFLFISKSHAYDVIFNPYGGTKQYVNNSSTSAPTSLQVYGNGVLVSSPTSAINTTSAITVTLQGTTTSQFGLNSSSVTLQGNTFNAAGKLVQLNGSNQLPAVSASLLTNIPTDIYPATSTIVPSNGIQGTQTNDNACTTCVGYTTATTVALRNTPASGLYFDAATLTLGGGDWACTGCFSYHDNGATLTTLYDVETGISTTSGNSLTGLVEGQNYIIFQTVVTFGVSNGVLPLTLPIVRESLSTSTAIYLKGYPSTYSVGNPQYAATLSCVRER